MTADLGRLSIRARLTLWYSIVVFGVLVGALTAVLWLHGHLGLLRLDQELVEATSTVNGVLQSELDETLSPERGVRQLVAELDLVSVGFAVLTEEGEVLAVKAPHSTTLSEPLLQSAGAPVTLRVGTVDVRLRATSSAIRGERLRVVVWTSLEALRLERRSFERAMILGVPIALLLAVACGFVIARRALGPLTDMARQARTIGGATPNARLVPPNPHDELGTLAHAFNVLLDSQAESLRAQRAFMADASHQLRTPVSVTRTAAQVTLDREGRTEAEYRESLEVVARQAERLTRMVDDMFTLALADAQSQVLSRAPLYLDELIEDVVDEARVLASRRNITLRAESSGEAPSEGDEHLLRQMVMNLLDNAIRHTPPQGTIVVSLSRSAGAYKVAVTDSGSGIAAEHVPRIFDRFSTMDGAGSEGGAGLGLPIARWIAESHGGSLQLESTGPQGSRFVATLPATGPGSVVTPARSA